MMPKKKFVGLSYLHQHSIMEQQCGIDADHVVVDRKDWEEVCRFFMERPDLAAEIGEITSIILEPIVFSRTKFNN